MKILLVSVHFAPAWIEGGVTLSTWNMARGLVAAGAAVRVVTTDAYLDAATRVPPERTEGGMSIRTVPILSALGAPAHRYGLAVGLGRSIRRAAAGVDLCLMQGLWALPVAMASRICRRRGLPYVLCARGTLEKISLSEKALKKRLYLKLVGARVIRQARAVYFASERELANSREALRGVPGLALPHGFDPIEPARGDVPGLRDRLGIAGDSLVLGLAGRVHPRKGFEVILPALQTCAERIHLVSFGPDLEGHLGRFRKLAREHGVEGRFHYLGYLEGEELRSTYASIDLLVLPSFGESFGNVVIEALGQGTEVMVSDKVALADYVGGNQLGRVVEGLDPRAWSAAITAWADSESRFDRRRAMRRVRDDYGLEACGTRILDALEQVLSRPEPARLNCG